MHNLVYISLLCLLFSVPPISQAWTHEPLADDEVEAVEAMPLTGIWKFRPDQGNVGNDEKWYSSEMDDSTWEDINVPGTWNEGQNVSVEWNYEGTAWYRRRIEIPQDWQDGNIRLRFLAVYLISDIWLNDKYLGNHKGGYTEFSFDVSDAIKPSGNVIAVRVDNKKRAFQVPGSSIDWWNCGGITREVFLERHPAIFLKKMFITPEVSGEAQRIPVKVKAWFDSKFDSQKDVEVRTETGNSIVTVGPSGTVCTMTLHIDQPRLWSPDTPELHILKLSWRLRGDDQGKWWTSQDRFGIRKIETRGTDIYLNGERIWLQGIAFHQDYGRVWKSAVLA
jgi:beta-galactosidase/beta-glucuronidase